jgi:rubredoxin
MKFKETCFSEETTLCRKRQRYGFVILVPAFIASIIFSSFALPKFVGLFGFWLIVSAFFRLKRNIVCPSCKANLSHLILDPNYSHQRNYFILSNECPESLRECPYCNYVFSKDRAPLVKGSDSPSK